jgi:tRNA-binding EMAP/Myf-like protein
MLHAFGLTLMKPRLEFVIVLIGYVCIGSSSLPFFFFQVRLKYAYVITCDEVRRDAKTNQPIELICSYDISTRGGKPPSSSNTTTRPGIIHWLESSTAIPCHVNLYDRLFQVEEPGNSDSLDSTPSSSASSSSTVDNEDNEDKIDPLTKDSFLMDINPNSLEILTNCYVEPSVRKDALGLLSQLKIQTKEGNDQGKKKVYASDLSYQWERNGYFALEEESTAEQLIFNRVVTLRDTWKKADVGKNTQVRNRGSSSSSDQRNPLTDEIGRIAFRTGKITSVQPHPNASSLSLCTVSCGDDSHPRTAIVGNVPIHLLQDLLQEAGTSTRDSVVVKDVIVVTNLKPAKLAGIESTVTLLVASTNNSSTEEGTGVWEILTTPSSEENIQLQFEHCGEPQPDEMLKNKGALKVWDRVKAALKVNEDGEVVYCNKNGKECRLLTGRGNPIVLQRIRNGIIQ